MAKAHDYAKAWGGGWFSTWAGITGIVGIAAVGVSAFINLKDVWTKAKKVLDVSGGATPGTPGTMPAAPNSMSGSGMGSVGEQQNFLEGLLDIIIPK